MKMRIEAARLALSVASVVAVLGVGVCTAACVQAPKATVRAASNSETWETKLIEDNAFTLSDTQDAIVRVVGPIMTCTGTLIAPDRVLTAHHCVVARGPRGEFLPRVVPAKDVSIELGGDYLPWGSVGLKAIVAPPCGHAGGRGDLAVLVLERALSGFRTMTPRLEAPPQKGELLDPIGFGRCAASASGIRRRNREGGPVQSVAPATFDINASICPGDSGGPLLARGTQDIVGVVSLSAMDADETTRNMSVMARIDAFRSVFVLARTIAEGADPSDMPPLGCD